MHKAPDSNQRKPAGTAASSNSHRGDGDASHHSASKVLVPAAL